MTDEQLQQWGPVALPVAVFVLVLVRNRRPRRLRLELMWILPLLFLAAAASVFASGPPPGPAELAGLAVALAAGGALGWTRGRGMEIHVDPATKAVETKASPWGLILLIAFFAVRGLANLYLEQNPGGATALDPLTLAHVLLMFGLGLVAAQRVEMWLRARRLLRERAAD